MMILHVHFDLNRCRKFESANKSFFNLFQVVLLSCAFKMKRYGGT
jgi:hypothetical protein